MKKILLAMVGFILLVGGALAQNSAKIDPVPRIVVNSLATNEKPIVLKQVKTQVAVVGRLAVTSVEMSFYNPNNRILEGELSFPLLEQQKVSRFALDINGKYREAVAVDKQIATEAFENTIRQKIDPAILEKTQGNNFKTRIYPLPAKGERKVIIAYEQELSATKTAYRYHMPIDFGVTLDKFSLSLKVLSNINSQPELEQTPWGSFSFDKTADAYIANYTKNDFAAKGQLVFSIPQKNDQQVYVEKGQISGDYYFYSDLVVKNNQPIKPVKQPNKIAIFWDTSSSMAQRDLTAELDFLQHYLANFPTVEVDVYTFNIALSQATSFSIANGAMQQLKTFLQQLSYDGASQLGILDFNQLSPAVDEILLFSDGISNFGKHQARLAKQPIVAINSKLVANAESLKYLAYTSAGKYINLTQQTVAQASQYAVDKANLQFLGAEYAENEIADFSPAYAMPVQSGQSFSVSGQLKTSSATIKLNFGYPGQVLQTEIITINAANAKDYNNLIEKFAIEKFLAGLELEYAKNKQQIKDYAKRFSIVTANTSLIVLDNVADYVRYEIVPPAELLGEYNTLLGKAKVDLERQKKRHLEQVVDLFKNYRKWWQKDFPKVRKPVSKPQVAVASPSGGEVSGAVRAASMGELPVAAPLVDSPEYTGQAANMAKMTESRAKRANKSNINGAPAKIKLAKWNPDTPYLKILAKSSKENLYSTYLGIKPGYQESPAFYLDVANLFLDKGLKRQALLILSNLAELELENYQLLKVLGNRLKQLGQYEYAIFVFDKLVELRPFEPQSYRDLALTYLDNKQYQKAIANFYKIIDQTWDNRFPQIELIAVEEMNNAIFRAKLANAKVDLTFIDKRLLANLPLDIKVVLNWDTDNTDMDLWVTDPNQEKCFYSHNLTTIGGKITPDFRQGFGPEAFYLKHALAGKYLMQTHYYGTAQQSLIGPTTLYLDIYTGYSTEQEKKQTIILRLDKGEGEIKIGEIEF